MKILFSSFILFKTYIIIGYSTGIGALGDSLRVLLNSCRKLEKLFLTSFRGLTDRDLEPLLFCQNLQQLDLLGAHSLTSEICVKLLSCLSLHMIDLSFCEGISNAQILEWRKLYPNVSIKRSSQANG
jgi:F-box/leucine-rich repeat protein 4